MKTKAIVACALTIGLFAECNASLAATTDWLSAGQTKSYMAANMAGTKAYATAIDCKDDGKGPLFKLTYKPFSGPPPFYRWNWLYSKSSDLAKAVGKLKLSDEKHLKYRVVHRSDYVAPNGAKMSCAIVYR